VERRGKEKDFFRGINDRIHGVFLYSWFGREKGVKKAHLFVEVDQLMNS
jgi:hypothetical protein